MKVIILAAGEGKRLRPLTEARPKCLVCVKGHSLLDYQLALFHSLGLYDIVLVTGYCAEMLKNVDVVKVHNPDFDRTNMVASLFTAKKHLKGDVVVCYGDILFQPWVLKKLIASQDAISMVVDDG